MFRQTLAFHNPPMVRLRLLLLLNIFPKWQEAGWLIVLIYLYIPSAEFSAFRVQQRFEQGGHNIPANDIVSRYPKSIKNLFLYSKVCDYTFCFNNKLGDVRPVWEKRKNQPLEIFDKITYSKIMEQVSYE